MKESPKKVLKKELAQKVLHIFQEKTGCRVPYQHCNIKHATLIRSILIKIKLKLIPSFLFLCVHLSYHSIPSCKTRSLFNLFFLSLNWGSVSRSLNKKNTSSLRHKQNCKQYLSDGFRVLLFTTYLIHILERAFPNITLASLRL